MVRIVALALGLALAVVPAAEAGRRTAPGASVHPHASRQLFVIQDRGLEVFGERRITVVPVRPFLPPGAVVVAPQPVYVVPSSSCLVPGYWTYQFVPPTWYNVWVPGQWTPDGSGWLDGHYEAQPYGSGYYQPLWVPERWAC